MILVELGCNTARDERILELIAEHQFSKILMVDANPFAVLEAKNNPPSAIAEVENWFISDEWGDADFYIPHFDEHKLSAHSSGKLDHVLKHGHDLNRIQKLSVPKISINELFARHSLSTIDYLFIDLEGVDGDVLLALDLDKYKIKNINFEYCHIPAEQMQKVVDKLTAHGYVLEDRYVRDKWATLKE